MIPPGPLAAPDAVADVPSYLSPTGLELVFALLGLVVLAAAVLVVTTRQLVHAALWLVVVLGGLAGCYLVLSAEFVAWVQVLIYLGAVVVLVLFGLMLTRAPIGVSTDLDAPRGQRVLAGVVAAAVAAVLVVVVVDGFRSAWIELPGRVAGGETTGEAIFRYWVLPFEVLSVLLLAALVGAIVVSRQELPRAAAGEAAAGGSPRTGPGEG